MGQTEGWSMKRYKIVRETFEEMRARLERFELAKRIANHPGASPVERTNATLVMWENCLGPPPRRVRVRAGGG